jgi:hypothetical protein
VRLRPSSISETRRCRASSPGTRCAHLVQEVVVDLVDDFQMARQQRSNRRTGQVSSASGISVWLV